MPSLDESYPALTAALNERYGQPGDDLVEPPVGVFEAYLRSMLEPRRASAVVDALRDAGLLDVQSLADADPAELTDVLRNRRLVLPPKAIGVLRGLARWIAGAGGVNAIEAQSIERIREALLAIRGVGAPTADAILLFGLRRPVYPVDRPTYRILVRHGWIDPTADYEEARETLEAHEPGGAPGLARAAFWLERVGAQYCRVSAPRCEECPMRPFLPERGPLGDAE